MRLYTRNGDTGETSLIDGSRVGKDHVRVSASGDVDELNAWLGFCRSAPAAPAMDTRIRKLQNELLALGSELATPPGTDKTTSIPWLNEEAWQRLETWIDKATEAVVPTHNFILPGGTELACRLHLTRTSCRRAERSVVTLSRSSTVRPEVIAYLNRLGDLLFAWARQANHEAGVLDLIGDAES